MYCVMVTVTIDPASLDEARVDLRDVSVARASSAPGFRVGYWMEPTETGDGLLEASSFVVYEDGFSAEAAAERARERNRPAGVTVIDIQVKEIITAA